MFQIPRMLWRCGAGCIGPDLALLLVLQYVQEKSDLLGYVVLETKDFLGKESVLPLSCDTENISSQTLQIASQRT